MQRASGKERKEEVRVIGSKYCIARQNAPQLEGHRQISAVGSTGKARKGSVDARERCTELDGFLDMALHLTRDGSLSSASSTRQGSAAKTTRKARESSIDTRIRCTERRHKHRHRHTSYHNRSIGKATKHRRLRSLEAPGKRHQHRHRNIKIYRAKAAASHVFNTRTRAI